MRIISTLLASFWLVSRVTAAPTHPSSDGCLNSVSTVYVTIPSSSIVVSSVQAITTIYLTVHSTSTIIEFELPISAETSRRTTSTTMSTVLRCTGMAVGGSNSISSAGLLFSTGAYHAVSLVSVEFFEENSSTSTTSISISLEARPKALVPTSPLIDTYPTIQTIVLFSSLAAQNGFTVHPASYSSTPITAGAQEWTTATINGETVSWGSSFSTCTFSKPTSSTISPAATFSSSGGVGSLETSSSTQNLLFDTKTKSTATQVFDGNTLKNNSNSASTISLITSTILTLLSESQTQNQKLSSTSLSSRECIIRNGNSTASALPSTSSSVLESSSFMSQTQSQILNTLSVLSSDTFFDNTSTKSSATLTASLAVLNSTSQRKTETQATISPPVSYSVSQGTSTGSSTDISSSPTSQTSSSHGPSLPQASSLSQTPSSSQSPSLSHTTISTAFAAPKLCGEHGDFTLNFDDIPPLSVSNNTNPNTAQPEPIFSPYHQFDFSSGFTVVPPPTDPYLPSSKPLLLEFIPSFDVTTSSPQVDPKSAAKGYSGQISAGNSGRTGCFSFNMYGADFGCDSKGPDCDFTFAGYGIDRSKFPEVYNQIVSETHSVPACSALSNCSLVPVLLGDSFNNLSYVRISLTVVGEPKI